MVNLAINVKIYNFIAELLATAASIIKPNPPTLRGNYIPEKIVNANVLSIFDEVRKQKGFRAALFPSISSIRSTLDQGNASVWLGGQLFETFPNWEYEKSINSKEKQFTRHQDKTAFSRGVTTIHELLHFNFSDEALAQAVSKIIKKPAPSGLSEASEFWGKELRNRCAP